MANFEIALPLLDMAEGGYANDPNDTGGETYRGISRKNFAKWAGWVVIDEAKRAKLPIHLLNDHLKDNPGLQRLVEGFYKGEFWDVMNLSAINSQAIANELFDTGVNMGTKVAGVFLQKALNVLNRNQRDYGDVPVTGTIGPLTIEAVNSNKRENEVVKILNCLQGSRYVDICLNNPKQEIFMTSWFKRVAL
jgi:lysozyme family protein